MKWTKLSKETKQYVGVCLLLAVFFIGVFAYVSEEMLEQELARFDSQIIGWLQSAISWRLTDIMLFFTWMGSAPQLIVLVIASALFMLWKKKRWEALFLVIAVGGGTLFNQLLKLAFHRERPDLHRLIEVTGYSFPSGHSMESFIFFGMIAILLHLFVTSRLAKAAIVTGAVLLILCVGVSRIYLGVHYPSDVVGGYAAGGAWLSICLAGLRIVLEMRKRQAGTFA